MDLGFISQHSDLLGESLFKNPIKIILLQNVEEPRTKNFSKKKTCKKTKMLHEFEYKLAGRTQTLT